MRDTINEFWKDDHRGHAIFAGAAGSRGGPYFGTYAVLRIEPNNNYRGSFEGKTKESYPTMEEAIAAANIESRLKLDELLDKK